LHDVVSPIVVGVLKSLVGNEKHSVSVARNHVGTPVYVQGKCSSNQLLLDLFLERSREFAVPVDYVEDCHVKIPDNQGDWVSL
jgi:hypothetical protein